MKYHILPMEASTQRDRELSHEVKQAASDLKDAVKNNINYSNRKNPASTSPTMYYLYGANALQALCHTLKDGDEIILHGEGQPFIMGLAEPSKYDLTPYKLAECLHHAGIPNDKRITLTLLACNSASDLRTEEGDDFNFARDTSESLHAVFHYQTMSVTGYTGLVVIKDNGACSVAARIDNHADKRRKNKNPHGSLEASAATYNNGEAVTQRRVLSDLSNIAYSWAEKYKEATREGQQRTQEAKKPGKSSPSNELDEENNPNHMKLK